MNIYLLIAIIVFTVLIIALGITLLLLKKKRKSIEVEEFPLLLEALGGKENITEVSQKSSRLSVLVNNKKIVDKEKIKEQGVETIVVSNKKITMVVGKKSTLMFNYINSKLN